MSVVLWILGAYVGVGTAWLGVMVVLARSDYEYVSPREAAIHLFGWPFVMFVLRLWWVAILAVAVTTVTVWQAIV